MSTLPKLSPVRQDNSKKFLIIKDPIKKGQNNWPLDKILNFVIPKTPLSHSKSLCFKNHFQQSPISTEPRKENQAFMKLQYIKLKTSPFDSNLHCDFELAREKTIISKLKSDTEEPCYDQINRNVVGSDAPRSFFESYKQLDRTRQQNDHFIIKDTMQTSMLNKSETLSLLPCKLGLIKLKGDPIQLNINRRSYGNSYGEMLSEGLKHHQVITDFNLGHNCLKSTGATKLIQQMAKQARSLDLVSNRVGQIGCETIAHQIMSQECRIEILNLEDNSLRDNAVHILCQALANANNSRLRVLNLSKNSLSNSIVDVLCRALTQTITLEELYLHWNLIKGNGGTKIFEVLVKDCCENLRVLDFSYNSLGQAGGASFVNHLNQFFVVNKSMMHLDLSVNQFTLKDCNLIAQQFNLNRTIYGFHFNGNYGYVDSKGFLILENVSVRELHNLKRINGTNQLRKSYSQAERIEKLKNVCWICDGWQQTKIKWQPGLSGDADTDPIYWHADFEGYRPIYVGQHDTKFEIEVMVPSGEMFYFYTANDTQTVNQMDKVKQCSDKIRQQVQIDDKCIQYMPEEMNYTVVAAQQKIIQNYEVMISILPRTPEEVYVPMQRIKKKIEWTYAQSVWAKKYKFDTTEHVRSCFERDWTCSKIAKFVKLPEDQKAIMVLLWDNYKMLKDTYKQYASYNPNGDVFSLSLNPLTDLVNQCQLIDGKSLKLSDVDLKFIATCSSSAQDWKGNYRNPERAIVRYQLMEFVVRVAEDKYVRGNPNTTMVQAVGQLIEQCRPHMSLFDSHQWRMEKYYCESCDVLLKRYKWVVDYLYDRNSTKKVKPGKPAFMCLEELKEICNRANLYDENFVDRDVNLAFNLSMMTQVDELESDRIFQMSWIEFCEALTRIAEKLSLVPHGREHCDTKDNQPTHYKLESLLMLLIERLVDGDTKKKYQLPSTSIFD